jgi:hypothetical protein
MQQCPLGAAGHLPLGVLLLDFALQRRQPVLLRGERG